ncbi:MAG: hypothetical protein IH969_01055, partial [Candidatus Krumholzibacteriota bacterium]|nr:hypothetical protein [Candidatus Krumholzibacteriota bacterium]
FDNFTSTVGTNFNQNVPAGGLTIGIITNQVAVFAGSGVVQCPLTIDFGTFRMVLSDVGVRSSARGGTLIGDAVRTAADSFADKIKKYKAIILITEITRIKTGGDAPGTLNDLRTGTDVECSGCASSRLFRCRYHDLSRFGGVA